jgi:hypothetical protein
MKDYQKPVAEEVAFATETIARTEDRYGDGTEDI